MNLTELATAVTQPEIHKKIVGNYRGAYSLGVMRSPEDENKAAFLLRVEGEVSSNFPASVTVDGEVIPIVVKGRFQRPAAGERITV